ncbi:MAG: AbrB/MazE/SpoVT family DNA-binding domain-containing protein, partial [Eubacteriales bacterium]
MKSTGVCRQVDELGRIVLPISIRKNLDIHVKDNMEIYTEGDKIILKKRQASCVFCGNTENVVAY